MGIIYDFFGAILNLIFEGVALITDVGTLGITIIMFTLVAQLLLTPIKMKQQRSMRAMNRMQPELQKLQKKYANKKDQASQTAYSQEMQALYKKHNANPLSGCLPLLIQLPLIYALYGVLRQPAKYINSLGEVYQKIAAGLQSQVTDFQQVINDIITELPSPAIQQAMASAKEPLATSDLLSHFTTQHWEKLEQIMPEAFTSISGLLEQKTNFELFIVNLVDTPQQLYATIGLAALLIPVIAGASTFIFSKVTMAASKASQPAPNPDAPNPAEGMMKVMNIMMPLMMGFISWTVPTGLALYWVAGNIIMMFQQMIVTRIVDKKEAIIDAQIEAKRQAELAASTTKKKKKKKKKKVVVESQTTDTTTEEHTAEEEPKKSDTQKED